MKHFASPRGRASEAAAFPSFLGPRPRGDRMRCEPALFESRPPPPKPRPLEVSRAATCPAGGEPPVYERSLAWGGLRERARAPLAAGPRPLEARARGGLHRVVFRPGCESLLPTRA